MNENKIAVLLNRIFQIVFFISFGIIFAAILIAGYDTDFKKRIIVLVSLVLLTCAFAGVYYFTNIKTNTKSNLRIKEKSEISNRNTKIIIFVSIGILFVIQLIAGYFLRINPVTDMNYINRYVYDFACNGNFDLIGKDYLKGSVYLYRYPNNFAIVFLLSFVCRIAYLIFGYVPRMVPVALNVFAINFSVLMTIFLAKRLFGNKKSLFVLFLCVLFLPYYTYTPYYYTDSLSMPFVILSIYLFVCALQSNRKYKKYVFMVLSGVTIFVGYKLKGSIIIIAAVAIIYIVLKFNLKKAICFTLAFVISIAGASAVYTVGFKSLNIVSEQQADECEYPLTHWIMMGLKSHGAYNLADSQYTQSFANKQDKQDANIAEIKKRISDYGVIGMAAHCLEKAVWTWEDGTYYISHHIEKPVKKNALHSIVLKNGEYYWLFDAYSCGFQLFLMLMMLISLTKGIRKPRIDITVFLKGIVFAAMLFFLIWETRSRYLYNFTPIFIILSVEGLETLTNAIKKFSDKKRNKVDKLSKQN